MTESRELPPTPTASVPAPVTKPPRGSLGRYLLWGLIATAIPSVAIAVSFAIDNNADNLNGPGGAPGSTMAAALGAAAAVSLGGAVVGMLCWVAVQPFAAGSASPWVRALGAPIVPLVLIGWLYLTWLGDLRRMSVLGFMILVLIGVGAYFLSFWHERRALRQRSQEHPGL